nr:hypothetical protein [uncultured Desulfobulbus sp.]
MTEPPRNTATQLQRSLSQLAGMRTRFRTEEHPLPRRRHRSAAFPIVAPALLLRQPFGHPHEQGNTAHR